jgi:serine/threonine protein phosphatase PrpC
VTENQARYEVGAASETGYVREENQDRMGRSQVTLGHVYVIADGMGGYKGGAAAAKLTVDRLQEYLNETPPGSTMEDAIRAAFEKTNKAVYEKAHSGDSETEGMGSAAVMLLTSGSVAHVGYVGDSRGYLYRKGRLRRLTTDHTKVQRMVEAGMLTPEQARKHPEASVLDRAIGHKPSIEADVSAALELKEGDGILLCSDGLSGYVDDLDIEAVLRTEITVQEIPNRLIQLALDKGSEDNVTVQFIQYGQRTPEKPGKEHTRTIKQPAGDVPRRTFKGEVVGRKRRLSLSVVLSSIAVLALAVAAVYTAYTQWAWRDVIWEALGMGAEPENNKPGKDGNSGEQHDARQPRWATAEEVVQLRQDLGEVRGDLEGVQGQVAQLRGKVTEMEGRFESVAPRPGEDKGGADGAEDGGSMPAAKGSARSNE